jgi:hypothetical protein
MKGTDGTIIRWTHGLPVAAFCVFAMAGALYWLTPHAPVSTPGSIVLGVLLGYAGLSAIIPETALRIRDGQLLIRNFPPMPLAEIGAFEIRLTQVLIYSREGQAGSFVVATPLGLKSAPLGGIRRLAKAIDAEVVVNLTGWPSRRLKSLQPK